MKEVFKLDHVSKKYVNDGKEFNALNDVSLEIREGEIFGIIGMSGAGKSTLVRTLNRLEEVSSGTVSFYGQDLSELNSKEIRIVRREIAMIFQGFNLLHQRNVLSNVMQPLKIRGFPKEKRKEKALEMLRVVGLEDKEKRISLKALRRPAAAGGDRKSPRVGSEGAPLRRSDQCP